MTAPADDLEERLSVALAAARTDSRFQVQPWSDGPARITRASRRRRLHHASLAVSAVAVLVLATVGGGRLYLNRSLDSVQHSSLGLPAGVPTIDGRGALAAKPAAGQPFTVLILGTDSRTGTGTEYGTNADACGCSDTIILARVDPRTAKVSLLSLPRDLRVAVSGYDKLAKLNSAYGKGPDNVVRTIEHSLNIAVNHWVVTDLAGFKSIVDAIGGITLDIPVPVKDKNAGLDLETTGCQKISGDQALALSRARELKYLAAGGKWTFDPTWENGRQRRQQMLMRVVAAHTVRSSLSNPITAAKVIGTFTGHNRLAVDNQITSSELVDLAGDFAGFDAAGMQTFSLPTHTQKIDGSDYEILEPAADVATIQSWYAAVQPRLQATSAPVPTATMTSPTTTAASVPPLGAVQPKPAGATTAAVAANHPESFDPRPCS